MMVGQVKDKEKKLLEQEQRLLQKHEDMQRDLKQKRKLAARNAPTPSR